jgi:hypothetical protein
MPIEFKTATIILFLILTTVLGFQYVKEKTEISLIHAIFSFLALILFAINQNELGFLSTGIIIGLAIPWFTDKKTNKHIDETKG